MYICIIMKSLDNILPNGFVVIDRNNEIKFLCTERIYYTTKDQCSDEITQVQSNVVFALPMYHRYKTTTVRTEFTKEKKINHKYISLATAATYEVQKYYDSTGSKSTGYIMFNALAVLNKNFITHLNLIK